MGSVSARQNGEVPKRVLVVDDEPKIVEVVGDYLRSAGFSVTTAPDGERAVALARARPPDLVVLDLGLPDMDGHEVLRELRGWSAVPVLVLSVRADEAGKVAALDAGANDYVTNPFGTPELMARIRALLRDAAGATQAAAAVYDDGRLRVDMGLREVTLDGQALTLTRKEYALLALLARHAGRVVTQPQLLREVWGPTHQEDTHYLRILVGKLRQKLGDDAASPRWIVTEPGVGLRLRAVE
jgi:two-component system KDP operon response regulator KdpE